MIVKRGIYPLIKQNISVYCFLLLTFVCLQLSPPISRAQERERRIHIWNPLYSPTSQLSDSVDILQILVGDSIVLPDRSFYAERNWLKNLGFLVRNKSGNRISAIGIQLMCESAEGTSRLVSLEIGNLSNSESIKENGLPLYPEELLKINLSDPRYYHFQKFLDDLIKKSDIDKVGIGRIRVRFEAGRQNDGSDSTSR